MDFTPFIPIGDKSSRRVYGGKTKSDRLIEQVTKFVEPPANADWFLFGPVSKGYISYSDLVNGTVNLYDVFVLNDIIDYQDTISEEIKRRLKDK